MRGSFCGPFLIGALSDANDGSFAPALLLLSGILLLASIMNLLFKEPGERRHRHIFHSLSPFFACV